MLICSRCGEEVTEHDYGKYADTLSSVDEDRFDDSGLCPGCFESVK